MSLLLAGAARKLAAGDGSQNKTRPWEAPGEVVSQFELLFELRFCWLPAIPGQVKRLQFSFS